MRKASWIKRHLQKDLRTSLRLIRAATKRTLTTKEATKVAGIVDDWQRRVEATVGLRLEDRLSAYPSTVNHCTAQQDAAQRGADRDTPPALHLPSLLSRTNYRHVEFERYALGVVICTKAFL